MLEIRRGIAKRSYENVFFREFSKNLAEMFEKYSIEGLLIGNSECELLPTLQIDALLITNKAICIIDFKNYEGEINLPSTSNFSEIQWTTKGNIIVRGGNSINPYVQLYKQKGRFGVVFNEYVKNELPENCKADPSHVHKIVCFQKPIKLNGKVPIADELSFFITDSEKYLDTIKDIIDVNNEKINLPKESFKVFNKTFIAEEFDINEKHIGQQEDVRSYSTEIESDNLYHDQKIALEKIKEFLKLDDEKIFIIQGTSSSGKSYLLEYIQEIAYNNYVPEVEFFALSNRVAANLHTKGHINLSSIYSYIYTRKRVVPQNDNLDSDVDNDDGSIESSVVEIAPLKKSENDSKSLFIVDEAQLVSADFHLTSKYLQHGSGKLLDDFISFTDIDNSNRKIIFIGDIYQLDFGKKENSSLNPKYFEENYKLKTKSFALEDKFEISPIAEPLQSLVNGIKNNFYNNLSITESDKLKFLNRDDVLPIIKNRIDNKREFHLLRFSNKQTYETNNWIKKDIINNGEDLENGDLVIFNNNCNASDTDIPPYGAINIENGKFGIVVKKENNIIPEVITPKGKNPVTLEFRGVTIKIIGKENSVNLLCIENYRNSENGELSDEEEVAFQILLKKEVREELKNAPFEGSNIKKQMLASDEYKNLIDEVGLLKERKNQGEKVSTKLNQGEINIRKLHRTYERKYRSQLENNLGKDSSSKYFKYKNCAHLRFGWALTVHKSMSYKWDEIFFVTDQGENRGRENENYFKWIYTGLTRAKNAVNLIHFRPITPLSKMEYKDGSGDVQRDKNILFKTSPESTISETYQMLNSMFALEGINIRSESKLNYQLKYELENDNGGSARVSLYYNSKGHVKSPKIESSEPKEFGEKVIKVINSGTNITDFTVITDKWRENFYKSLSSYIDKKSYKLRYISQSSFKDEIKIVKKEMELVLDMHYGKDGFFSSAICSFYNNDKIWEEIKVIFDEFKGQ